MFSPDWCSWNGSYNLLFVSTWKLLRCSPFDGIPISFSEHLETILIGQDIFGQELMDIWTLMPLTFPFLSIIRFFFPQ